MRTKVTKWMAGISSAAMLASFSALSVPAFAAEYETMQAEAYAASLTNEKAQTVARYFLDNGFSLEETEEMTGWYMDGLAIIESEQNANSGVATASVNTGKAYYSGTARASTQHYGVIIIDDPGATVRGSMWLTGVTRGGADYIAFTNAESQYVKLNGYNNATIAVDEDNDSIMSYTARTTASTTETPLAMCKFPIEVGSAYSNEAAIYNAIDFDYSLMQAYSGGENSTFKFHTYALGDFDHNGIVNNADYNYIVDFCMLLFDGKFDYTDTSDNVAYQVNILAADANKDGTVTMQDAIAVGSIVNG